MDSSDFSTLIGRLEREADAHPQLYLGKVAVAAALGFLVPGLVVLGILACCFAIVHALVTGATPSILAAIGALAGAAALIATIRAHARPGRGAGRSGCYAGRRTGSVPPDRRHRAQGRRRSRSRRVKINGEFKLGIRQIPRWGVFGGYRNHLHVGAPLLLALSADEFCALLAHEIAHLGGEQTRVRSVGLSHARNVATSCRPGLRIRRTHSTACWQSIIAGTRHGSTPTASRWRAITNTSPISIAACVTSAQTLARALIQVELASRFLADVYWARFLARVEEAPEPPYKPYSLLPRAFKILEKEPSRQQWLAEALRRYAVENDTHPSLAERLAALDVAPHLPPPATTSAALMTLGPAAQPAIDHCDDVWRAQNLANWRKRHDQIREARWKTRGVRAARQQHARPPKTCGPRPACSCRAAAKKRQIDSLAAAGRAQGRRFPDAHMLLAQLLLKYGEEQGLQHLRVGGPAAGGARGRGSDDRLRLSHEPRTQGRSNALRTADPGPRPQHRQERRRRRISLRRIVAPVAKAERGRSPARDAAADRCVQRPQRRYHRAGDGSRNASRSIEIPGRGSRDRGARAGCVSAHRSHAGRAVDPRCQRRSAAQDERPSAGDCERVHDHADPRQRNRRRDSAAFIRRGNRAARAARVHRSASPLSRPPVSHERRRFPAERRRAGRARNPRTTTS